MFFILCQTINVLWNMIQLYLILTNQKLQVLQKQTNKTFCHFRINIVDIITR